MFAKNRRISILEFLIALFLMFGDANGFAELPASASTFPATTTTLASSNAPATITNIVDMEYGGEGLNETSATTTTTTIPRQKHENDEVTFVASKTFEGTADVHKTAPSVSIATKSFLDGDEEENELRTEERKNMENEGNGNAVKTQIKYAREQTKAKTTTTTKGALNRNVDEVNLLGVMQVKLTAEGKANALETTREEINESSRQLATEDTRTERPTFTSTTKTPTPTTLMPHSAIHVERQLKNGLYRIKLAEIVTDEFNGSGIDTDEATRIATNPSTTATAPATNAMEGKFLQHQQQIAVKDTGGGNTKINIVDLYPMKIEDFNPIISDSNAKLLKERTIFSREDADEHRQNLMPNEVEVDQDATTNRAAVERVANNANIPRTVNIRSEGNAQSMSSSSSSIPENISDFTGKLLAEQDGVITEIEQKFRLNEFVATDALTAKAKPTSIPKMSIDKTTTIAAIDGGGGTGSSRFGFNVNHRTLVGYDFIDRRVKKSFDFPMHRAASDAISIPHVDFANTKFNTDPSSHGTKDGSLTLSGAKLSVVASHPEFSTTKFYNSKELYNEMLQHNRQKLQLQQQLKSSEISATTTTTTKFPTVATSASSRFQGLSNQKFQVTEIKDSIDRNDLTLTSAATLVPITDTPTPPAAVDSKILQSTHSSPSLLVETKTRQPKKFQKELKRAKLLLKTILPATTTTTATTTSAAIAIATQMNQIYTQAPTAPAEASAQTVATSTPLALATATTVPNILSTVATSVRTNSTASAIAALTGTTDASLPDRRATNPTKSSSKPIARPRILSRLQEKINSLECEIQSVPQDSNLWRGNETHELMLPIASPMAVSWEGEAEIQSGDVLIVEINDTQLIANHKNKTNSAHTTQVYQVTRSGHEHCDVTEGILLDITPLVVDGRKLVTLYDKDLTEGVNLLIVVSELWGVQCVRLKVTTKTDNCGENADCSGKGACLSNTGMEEYECQCCSGFAGPHCEEIDACTPSPCTNNGICVDLSQGHEGNSYQCLCPYGYTGKNCQYEADPCNPAECMNGGSCVGNSTHFRCDCTPGYTGPLCQHSLNECESSPCVHGICVDQEDGFRCFCQPGFAGELCNFEYNECESNPCQNGNECIDHIGRYECRCMKGYTGSRCQFKVDLCENRPCPEGHRCIDHGNDFSCECPGGENGPDCNQMTRTQCNVNPCTHGGTCWSSGDSFYCACRPGYTGTMCEDEFVVETVISSSEFMVDDTSARNFNEKTFGSSVVLKSPIELHNAYFAAGVLAAAIFIVAIVVTICHCKVNQTYRKFSTRSTTFFPILGFGRRPKSQNKLNKHWLSGKGLGNGNPLRSSSTRGHIPATNGNQYTTTGSTALQQQQQQQHQTGQAGQLHERPFQRHLAMNLENDMYYTVDFSENSQHSPLIQ